ncbi:NAD(P)-dependent oxidoreductase [Halosimplex litoreum]|uniref:NAD(P)-dependent oxidoreductase n=1 Tax=Halosimplex litoreum TaxID=1198301 RepID=A0A7T3FXW7_9EURY|nr:NAD(P)-binding domain-containing protein [Halosimplex litoreum]QPV62710.1 NAD(P)-dependent oxidoreductase [Halosimplex litoreum]
MPTVGVIGVGYIGKRFLDRLADTDYDTVAYDVDASQVEAAQERGAAAAESPADATRRSEFVVLALPGTPEVEAVMEAEDGVLGALSAGQTVVDVTTTHPDTSRECEQWCEDRGVAFVEAPITRAAPRDGAHMMVGGTEAAYGSARDLIESLSDDHLHVGAVGRATILKLALQMRYAGRTALDAEIVEFTRDNGVDPAHLRDFFGMDVSERLLDREFEQGIEGLGGLAIWDKDLGYARDVARETGTALPINAAVHEAYKATVRRAGSDEAHAATLLRYWELLNDAGERAFQPAEDEG